jgi:RNA polymerase sigma-B factor
MPTTVSSELKCESLSLLHRYHVSPSTQLRNRVVNLNLGLVRRQAHYFMNTTAENFEDLVQVGVIGLIRAIERFDPTKGNAFSSFAVPYIRGEIQHYLRDKSPQVKIPRRWQDLQRQASTVHRDIRDQQRRMPTDQEMALALDISQEEWQDVKLAIYNRSLLSLDAPINSGEQDAGSLGDLLPDANYRSFQLIQEDRIRLHQALATLEQRTCQVLEFVFFHDLTQKEVAEVLGISAVTVSRQVKKGLIALKQLMGAPEDEAILEAELN